MDVSMYRSTQHTELTSIEFSSFGQVCETLAQLAATIHPMPG